MHLYIPTYKRVNRQQTFKHLPERWKSQCTLVANEEEAPELRSLYGAHVLVHPPEITTIAAKRAWIIEQCPYDYHMQLDDDLKFQIRKPGVTNLRTQGDDDIEVAVLLDEFADKMATGGYVHGGISARQGNNRWPERYREVGRVMYAIAFHSETARTMDLGRINTREDMDYTLQLLRRGLPNLVQYHMAVSPLGYNADGGTSTERTMESSNADAYKLAELHPGYVRVVDKEYTASIPRKEVVVSWKKAYEDAKD